MLPFLGLMVLCCVGAAWWADRTYVDAINHGCTAGKAWAWIGAGAALALLIAVVLFRQAGRWGRGEEASGWLYRTTRNVAVVLGGGTLATAATFNASHHAWRLAIVAFLGTMALAWAVGFIWLGAVLPKAPRTRPPNGAL
jgi:hypothetical protein